MGFSALRRARAVSYRLRAAVLVGVSALVSLVLSVAPNSATAQASIRDISPTLNSNLTVTHIPSGRAISLATSSDGQRVYAGTVHAGLWRSDDGGLNFTQITSPQTGNAAWTCPPGSVDGPTQCVLASRTIAAIAVSPVDPDLIFVGTANDRGRPERDGVYRSIDGGRTWRLVYQQGCDSGGVPDVANQPVGQIMFAPDDPTKVWAAVGCAVAYSTVGGAAPSGRSGAAHAADIGLSWNAVRTPPPRTPHAFHLAVGANLGGDVRAVWACGGIGSESSLWYSSNGGLTFRDAPDTVASQIRCDAPTGMHQATQTEANVIAVDPRQAASAWFIDTGAPGPGAGGYEFDFCTPTSSPACPATPPAAQAFIARPCDAGHYCGPGLAEITVDGSGAFNLSLHPRPPLIDPTPQESGGLSLLGVLDTAGRYLLFYVDGSTVHVAEAPVVQPDAWHRLDAPDVGEVCTPLSIPGALVASCPNDGSLRPHDRGTPSTGIHVDPHAIAASAGLSLHVSPTSDAVPVERALFSCGPSRTDSKYSARLVMSSDGGIVVSNDCGVHWTVSNGFNTLVAGDFAGAGRAGLAPGLYFGGRDDDSWWSSDGGLHWQIADDSCGDCEGYYADTIANVVTHRFRYSEDFGVWLGHSRVPNLLGPMAYTAAWNAPRPWIDTHSGWSPLIQTLPSADVALPGIDMVMVAGESDAAASTLGDSRYVWRKIAQTPWERVAQTPIGAGAWPVVQAAGGHLRPVYYVADRTMNGLPAAAYRERAGMAEHLWRSRSDASGHVVGWDCIVPGPSAPGVLDGTCRSAASTDNATCPAGQTCRPWSFVVDPYDARVLYILDNDGVKESVDRGDHFAPVPVLTDWLSDHGRINPPCRWTCDFADTDNELAGMVFDPVDASKRFAFGPTGVFITGAGMTPTSPGATVESWDRLLDSASLPCQPTRLFHNATDPAGDEVYVGCVQRGVLAISLPTRRLPTKPFIQKLPPLPRPDPARQPLFDVKAPSPPTEQHTKVVVSKR